MYSFAFVCHKGGLELKALLLAASIALNARCKYEIVVCVPQPESIWGVPAPETMDLLNRLGARMLPVSNPLASRLQKTGKDPFYFCHANKIDAVSMKTRADKIISMDTDIVLLKGFSDESAFPNQIDAKPVDVLAYIKDDETWQRLYKECRVKLPVQKFLSSHSHEPTYPYFNSGVIAIDPGTKLSKVWWEMAEKVSRFDWMPPRELYSDQVALPIAIQKLGLKYGLLPEDFNFPVHLKPLETVPTLGHYHGPRRLRTQPFLCSKIMEIAREHPAILKMIEADKEWSFLLNEGYS